MSSTACVRDPFCRITIESGQSSIGPYNQGRQNAGWSNSGNGNSGDRNSGSYNAGNDNTGQRNAGNGNEGDLNAGRDNGGVGNAGDRNQGRRNAGSGNAGSWNAGSWNTGSRNAGSFNSGHGNIGDWNVGRRCLGCFCAEESETIRMFDQPCDWTVGDWFHSRAKRLLERLPRAYADESGRDWEGPSDEAWRAFAQAWWEALPMPDASAILLLPNERGRGTRRERANHPGAPIQP